MQEKEEEKEEAILAGGNVEQTFLFHPDGGGDVKT